MLRSRSPWRFGEIAPVVYSLARSEEIPDLVNQIVRCTGVSVLSRFGGTSLCNGVFVAFFYYPFAKSFDPESGPEFSDTAPNDRNMAF